MLLLNALEAALLGLCWNHLPGALQARPRPRAGMR